MRKTHLSFLFVAVLQLLGFVSPMEAQPTCSVQTFNLRDGLAANYISGMEQSADGMIWVSTWNGLSCYDGYQFTTFRNQKGIGETLSSNRIVRIRTDVNGSVWCVTSDGNLYRFDTHQCRFIDVAGLIHAKYGVTMKSRNIYALHKGVSWVTQDNGQMGLVRIDDNVPLDQRAVELMRIDTMVVASNFVNRVVEDRDGREWILTDKCVKLYGTSLCFDGRYEYIQQLGQRVYMATPDGQLGCWQMGNHGITLVDCGVKPASITCLEPFGSGCLLMGTDCGLLVIDIHGGVQQLSDKAVNSLFIDSRQRIWILADDGTCLMLHGAHSSQTLMRGDIRQQKISGLTVDMTARHPLIWLEDDEQTMWAVTGINSANYFDEQQRCFVKADMQDGRTKAVGSQQIEKCFVDSQCNLWFSTTRDLSVMRFRHNTLRFLETCPGYEVRALASDGRRQLWTGSTDGCVMVFDSLMQLLGYLNPAGKVVSQHVSFSDSKIYALTFGRDRRLWIGTRGDGLYSVDLESERVNHYVSAAPEGLNCDQIYAIDIDNEGRLWIGTYGGGLNLAVTGNDGQLRFLNTSNGGLKGIDSDLYANVRRITRDGQGRIMVSTTGGLLVSDPIAPVAPASSTPPRFHCYTHVKGDTASLLTSDVMQTLFTRSGRLLVATMGGGMQYGEEERFHRLRHFTADEGNVLDMVEDGDGQVWVVRETTVDRYDPLSGRMWQVGRNALDDNTEFSEAQPVYDSLTGRVVIGAQDGLVFFHPYQMKSDTYVPRIVFTSVRYHGEQTEQPLLNSGALHVDCDHRNLTIRFAALNYRYNEQLNYAYMLEGVDRDWNYVGRSHEASFNRLPAGRHRLLVRSTNNDGEWQENVAVLIIDCEPTFWESWMGLALKIGIALLVVFVVFHIYRLRQQIRLERRMNAMKSNFYEDVSQQLREPLSMMSDPMAEEMLAVVDGKINEYELAPPEIVDEDKRMMEQLMVYLEKHIGDSDMKIEDMASSVMLSRTVFYSKVKAMTGMAPVDFVRHLRFKRAYELLEKSHYTVSQIAYQIGFTDPKYFSKCFKKETGLTPSEYREKVGNGIEA